MIQSRLQANRILFGWESRVPPEDRNYPLCECCGNPISPEEVYNIRGRYYDEDCAKEMCREYVIDEPAECSGCEETLEEMFYKVGDDCYCEQCFDRYSKE